MDGMETKAMDWEGGNCCLYQLEIYVYISPSSLAYVIAYTKLFFRRRKEDIGDLTNF